MEKRLHDQRQRQSVQQDARRVVSFDQTDPPDTRLALERKIAALQHRLSQREHEVWTLRRLLLYH